MQQRSEVTLLLQRVESGEAGAVDHLLPLVYEELKAAAVAKFQSQQSDHTLQPTALVHEAYVKLVQSPDPSWTGREHFCAVASTAMRQILIDHARAKNAQKRKSGGERVHLTQIESPSEHTAVDLLALEEALDSLSQVDAQGARVVELRYFGGMSIDETARQLDTSPRTVDRVWRRSKAWIQVRLSEAGHAT